VTIEDADGALNDQVDAAYRAKYDRYAASIVDSITKRTGAGDHARARAARIDRRLRHRRPQ
jgi:hypothetical protein